VTVAVGGDPCGGQNGPTNDKQGPDAPWAGYCCEAGSTCTRQADNPWYYECQPN
jgi:hypothetical protein